jgi:hypothetical protein
VKHRRKETHTHTNGLLYTQALSQLVSWPFSGNSDRVDQGVGSRLIENFLGGDTQSALRSIAEEEAWISSKLAETPRKSDEDEDAARPAESNIEEEEEERKIFQDLKPVQNEADEAIAPRTTVQAEKQDDATTMAIDESWREFVQQGATLKREAKSRLEVGLLDEAAKLAEDSRNKFTLAAEKGFRNAVKESQAASKLLLQIQNAGAAQKVARDEAKRLTEEATKLLDGGDAAGAMTKASLAVKALQMVEQNYGRVSTAEVTKVIELRVRAEEKERIRLELQAKSKEESKKTAKTVTAPQQKDAATVVNPTQNQGTQLKKEPKSTEKKFEVKTVQQQATQKDTTDRATQKKQEKTPTVEERKPTQQAGVPKQKEEKSMIEAKLKQEKQARAAEQSAVAQDKDKALMEAKLKQEKEARTSEQNAAKQDEERALIEAKLKRQREAAEAARAAEEAEAKQRAEEEEKRSELQRQQDEAAQALAKKEEAMANLARQRDGNMHIYISISHIHTNMHALMIDIYCVAFLAWIFVRRLCSYYQQSAAHTCTNAFICGLVLEL